ncbi:unnamed protein product, partial [Meganyctiphanes norvegica]
MTLYGNKDYENFVNEFSTKHNMPEFLKAYEDIKNNPVELARWNRQEEAELRPKSKKWWILRKIILGAVNTGNERAVSSAIRKGADVTLWLISPTEYDFKMTFLGLAAMHGHHNLINILLKAGIDIDDPGGSNRRPLHSAVERNDVEFATKLIQAGADIDATTIETEALTPLHLAVNNGHLECITLLIKEKANIDATEAKYNYTPLHRAVALNQLTAVEMLLDAGCNRDARIHLGGAALQVAALHNRREAAELLIKRGFDPELKDYDGHTPLESAEFRGHESLAHWFAKLRKGKYNDYDKDDLICNGQILTLDQNTKNLFSEMAYQNDNLDLFDCVNSISHITGYWKRLKLSIPMHCSGYYQVDSGFTLLHSASENGNFKAVKLLVEELEIYPNLKTYNGDLPTDLAESAGHQSIAHYLKNAFEQKPLTINCQNALYDKLLSVISSGDDVQEASRLLTQGAPLESYGRTSPSALAMAIQWNRVMIIELLLAAGADLTVKHYGKTLLQVAYFSPDVTSRVKMIITR